MEWVMVLIAILPIVTVGVLMVGLIWPSSRAMPVGWLVAAALALAVWGMPLQELMAASAAGAIKALDILLIVFGAILILQLMKKSGGMDGISRSMASLSKDRRVQALFAGAVFTVPQMLVAYFVGPELPALLGALIALPFFLWAVSKGFLPVPPRWRWLPPWLWFTLIGCGGPVYSWGTNKKYPIDPIYPGSMMAHN